MGFLTRKIYGVEVVLGDVEPGAVRATVATDTHGREPHPRDAVAFAVLLVVAVLRGCRNAPEVAEPYIELCRAAGEVLYESDPEECKTMRLSEHLDEYDAEGSSAGDVLVAGIPKVGDDPGPPPTAR
jgi:hypothetical protein